MYPAKVHTTLVMLGLEKILPFPPPTDLYLPQDDHISVEELCAGTDLTKDQAILCYRRLDTDHDGKLNREEFTHLMDRI